MRALLLSLTVVKIKIPKLVKFKIMDFIPFERFLYSQELFYHYPAIEILEAAFYHDNERIFNLVKHAFIEDKHWFFLGFYGSKNLKKVLIKPVRRDFNLTLYGKIAAGKPMKNKYQIFICEGLLLCAVKYSNYGAIEYIIQYLFETESMVYNLTRAIHESKDRQNLLKYLPSSMSLRASCLMDNFDIILATLVPESEYWCGCLYNAYLSRNKKNVDLVLKYYYDRNEQIDGLAATNNVEQLKKIVVAKENLQKAIRIAIYYDNLEAMVYLINHETDPQLINFDMSVLIATGRYRMVECIIQNNFTDIDYVLYHASIIGDEYIMDFAQKYGAKNINLAFCGAAYSGNAYLVKKLLQKNPTNIKIIKQSKSLNPEISEILNKY